MRLSRSMDDLVEDNMVEFLSYRAEPSEMAPRPTPLAPTEVLAPTQQMTDDLLAAVHQLVEMQANIWSRSISEAQKHWTNWSSQTGDQLRDPLSEALDKSLTQHALQIEKIQQEAGRQVDSRWQQWQITLSDQARVMHAQQKELVRQTEAIDRLVASTCELKKAEEAIHDSFANFELLEQLRQTTLGVGEAVAVLATSLERAGIIRGMPVRPRSARKPMTKRRMTRGRLHERSQTASRRSFRQPVSLPSRAALHGWCSHFVVGPDRRSITSVGQASHRRSR